MKLSDFEFTLPKNLIPKEPVNPRDSCQLMVLNRKDLSIEKKTFTDIADYMNKGDCLVLNDTKVFPARLFGRKEKTQAKIEVFLLRELNNHDKIWDVIVDPARKVRIGNKIYFADDMNCEIIDNTTSRGRTVRFNYHGEVFDEVEKIGTIPLPPYIKREVLPADKKNYQTVFANKNGSVAAPTAGLHFSTTLLKKLEKKGVRIVFITLHIGLGTFNPVEVEDLTKHKMNSEYFEISQDAAASINKTILSKNKVFVCGTSCARALESSLTAEGLAKYGKGWTDKFIFPPFLFRITDKLITNFHFAESTPLMLVSAFADYDFLMKAYKKAIKEEYRFLSFGDAMLIL